MKHTKRMANPIPGNRYEVRIWGDHYILMDNTQQRLIATSKDDKELILYAQHNNMINADAVIIS